jgi:hypothetical protein
MDYPPTCNYNNWHQAAEGPFCVGYNPDFAAEQQLDCPNGSMVPMDQDHCLAER